MRTRGSPDPGVLASGIVDLKRVAANVTAVEASFGSVEYVFQARSVSVAEKPARQIACRPETARRVTGFRNIPNYQLPPTRESKRCRQCRFCRCHRRRGIHRPRVNKSACALRSLAGALAVRTYEHLWDTPGTSVHTRTSTTYRNSNCESDCAPH